MDYEKAYKEALGRAEKVKQNDNLKSLHRVIDIIFPELAESEDERIKREFCKDIWTFIPNEKAHKYIAWLEKQKGKDALIKELGEYKVKYTQKIIEQGLEQQKLYDNGVENERISKEITQFLKQNNGWNREWLAWLEKQGELKSNKWTEGDVVRHGGVLAFVTNGRRAMKSNYEQITIQYPDEWKKADSKERKYFFEELEKQGEQKSVDKAKPKLSEEEQNRFAKGVLSSCALSFINYLDAHKYEGKMCVSNGECEDIENAFHNAMWDRLHRYYCKYIEKEDEKPQGKSALDAIKEEKEKSKFGQYKEEGDIVVTADDGVLRTFKRIEPKFKVGDLCIDNEDGTIFQIVKVLDNTYAYKTNEGNVYSCTHYSLENDARLWSIHDAKDGDVISNGEMIVIFKKFEEPSYKQHIVAYIGLDTNGNIQITDDTWTLGIDKAKPATKEQRDLLFSKIRKAGYEWDAEKKRIIQP